MSIDDKEVADFDHVIFTLTGLHDFSQLITILLLNAHSDCEAMIT